MENPHYRFIREYQLLKERDASVGAAFARQKEIVRKANLAGEKLRQERDMMTRHFNMMSDHVAFSNENVERLIQLSNRLIDLVEGKK